MNARLGVPLRTERPSDEPPFAAMDPVVTLTRRAGRVLRCFRQPLGAKRWVCWVGFPNGECSGIYASDLLRVQPPPEPSSGVTKEKTP